MINQGKIYSDELLNSKRLQGDQQADDFISEVFADDVKKKELQQWISAPSSQQQFNWLSANFPDVAFIQSSNVLPPWADANQMKAGAVFFARHAEMIMSLLGLLSLPYCYTAANGAMVLYISELIRKQTTKRLHDTAVFVWEIMAPDAFGIQGNAFQKILKVRILHAAVRYYTLKSGKWNESWGLPINQEDMAGTNLSFSLIVMRGLRSLGYSVSREEQNSFMHVWAVIGHLSGLHPELIPENTKMAQLLDLSIKQRQFQVSDHGRALTRSLTDHILKVNKSKATADDILGLMRHLLGNDIADMLSIEAPALPAYKLALLRTTNYLKGFKADGNTIQNYRSAYAKFKKQTAAIA
jgi:hypothetical protein